MTQEKFSIEVTRYRDPNGNPTCSLLWGVDMCPFLRIRGVCGKLEVCGFTGDTLKRRDNEGRPTGYLIPYSGCPVWPEEKP